MSDDLIVRREGAVATLVINRPEQRNAISYTMWESIPQLLADIDADDGIQGRRADRRGRQGVLRRRGYQGLRGDPQHPGARSRLPGRGAQRLLDARQPLEAHHRGDTGLLPRRGPRACALRRHPHRVDGRAVRPARRQARHRGLARSHRPARASGRPRRYGLPHAHRAHHPRGARAFIGSREPVGRRRSAPGRGRGARSGDRRAFAGLPSLPQARAPRPDRVRRGGAGPC